jgi:hypothetical protein
MKHNGVMSAAVAAACATLDSAAEKSHELVLNKPGPSGGKTEVAVAKRRLTIDIRICAEAGDDSPLAPLVAAALLEFIESKARPAHGKFESKAGVDVAWRACNEFLDAEGNRVAHDGNADRYPVPMGVGTVTADGSYLRIKGVNYSTAFFKLLANPDPAKRYSFVREGSTVIIKEV